MLLHHNISMMQWGEGQGLVLSNGDLLACGWFKNAGRKPGEGDTTDSVGCVASSDRGQSWTLRGRLPTPHEPTNEVAAALTPSGSIYLSMRTNSVLEYRMQSWSHDGGRTFSAIGQAPLPAPHCNAGAVNPAGDNKRLLLAHIEPTVLAPGRRNMVLRLSVDGGSTFAAPVQIDRGVAPTVESAGMPAGYITLTTTNDPTTVGALYENANAADIKANPKAGCYQRISYQNITLKSDDDDDDAPSPTAQKLWTAADECPAVSTRHEFVAASWDPACEGTPAQNPIAFSQCNFNLTRVVPPVIIPDDYGFRHFGDNASVLVPRIIHGFNTSGKIAEDHFVWPFGTKTQPVGHRMLRFEGPDRDFIMNAAADDILGGWNATNKSYPAGHPCSSVEGSPVLGGQVAGPWPGIWLDAAAAEMGKQSELFFEFYKAAGGALDEIVLDTELGWLGFDTWEIAGQPSCLQFPIEMRSCMK